MTPSINRICVYCGSNAGAHDDYTRAAEELGAYLAGREITIV